MRSVCVAHDTGISRSRTARPASPMIRIGRRRRRSTYTPAGSAKRMNGRKPSTPSSENASGEACSWVAASNGIARPEICEPNSLIDWPDQSFTKSVLFQSPPDGRRNLRIEPSPVEGRREAVLLALAAVRLAEVVDELLQPAYEATCIGVAQTRAYDAEGRLGVAADRKHLLCSATEGGRCDVRDVLGVGVGALEKEETSGAAVEPLRHRSHLPRSHDLNEARLLEHFHVVAHGALRERELCCELGRREGSVAEQDDDLRAEIVAQRLELLRLAHDEDVVR